MNLFQKGTGYLSLFTPRWTVSRYEKRASISSFFFPFKPYKKVMAKKVRSSTAVWTFLFSTPSGPGQVMSTITFQFFAIFYPRAVAASAVAIRYRSARPERDKISVSLQSHECRSCWCWKMHTLELDATCLGRNRLVDGLVPSCEGNRNDFNYFRYLILVFDLSNFVIIFYNING